MAAIIKRLCEISLRDVDYTWVHEFRDFLSNVPRSGRNRGCHIMSLPREKLCCESSASGRGDHVAAAALAPPPPPVSHMSPQRKKNFPPWKS